MRCPDGVRLAARIWRPEGEGPWPVLLMRQPYGRAIASTITYAHPAWYAGHGFLVVVQDVRGRGDSEGEFRGFAQEAADGAEAVRWARRLPAGNGRVGTYGFSYQGATQLLNDAGAAVAEGRSGPDRADPLPDCLAPAMCGLDERHHWAAEGGAHWWATGLGWALQLAADGCRRRGDAAGWDSIRRSLETGAYVHDGLALLESHDREGMGLGWLRRDPAMAAGWPVHPVAEELLRRPMLLIGGWHDPQLRGVLDLWRRARHAGGDPLLRIGAWSHLDWRGGVDTLQLAFFRRQLQEATDCAPPEAGALVQCLTTGLWHPVPAAEPAAQWGLQADGLAAVRSDAGELRRGEPGAGAVVFVHDPWRPVPGRGGHLGPDPGVVERTDLDERSDVACFTTPPLLEDLQLLGEPQLTIRVAADQPGFDLCASLSVLQPNDRRVEQLCLGIGRFRGEHCLRPLERHVRLQPLAASVQRGQRLRLSLAGAAWPQFAVNPGDGSLPAGGSGPQHRVITLQLDLEASRLWLAPLLGAN
jgi:uncharacterized protein